MGISLPGLRAWAAFIALALGIAITGHSIGRGRSERARGCTPRWLKLDRAELERTGGVAIYLGDRPHVETVAERLAEHPWARLAPIRPTATPPIRFPTDR